MRNKLVAIDAVVKVRAWRVNATLSETTLNSDSCNRIKGKLSLNFSIVCNSRANQTDHPPGAKENPGTAATGPGLDAKNREEFGRKTLRLNWGAAQ